MTAPNDEIAFDDLHPHTQRILSRRGFIGGAGKAAASVTFLGLTMTVVGCSKDSTTSTGSTGSTAAGGSTTAKAGGAGTSTTAAKTYGTGKPGSLYNELGGHEAIVAVVGLFLTNVAADPVINKRFANTDIPALQEKLVDQIGEATGGTEKYTGLSMEAAHKGMNITVEEFNALVGDLGKALTTAKVPEATQQKLVDALAPMQSQIVGQ